MSGPRCPLQPMNPMTQPLVAIPMPEAASYASPYPFYVGPSQAPTAFVAPLRSQLLVQSASVGVGWQQHQAMNAARPGEIPVGIAMESSCKALESSNEGTRRAGRAARSAIEGTSVLDR